MASEPEVMAPESAESKTGAALEKRELASDVLAAQGRAQVQARYLMARQNPRDWDLVRQRVLKDCDRPFFADAALYSKPMGNSKVTGLSIRFAEAAQRALREPVHQRRREKQHLFSVTRFECLFHSGGMIAETGSKCHFSDTLLVLRFLSSSILQELLWISVQKRCRNDAGWRLTAFKYR